MEYLAFLGIDHSISLYNEDFDNLCFWYLIQEHVVKTSYGSLSVAVYGDRDKPALITYPDLALNCKEMSLKKKYEFLMNFCSFLFGSCYNPDEHHSKYCYIFHRKFCLPQS